MVCKEIVLAKGSLINKTELLDYMVVNGYITAETAETAEYWDVKDFYNVYENMDNLFDKILGFFNEFEENNYTDNPFKGCSSIGCKYLFIGTILDKVTRTNMKRVVDCIKCQETKYFICNKHFNETNKGPFEISFINNNVTYLNITPNLDNFDTIWKEFNEGHPIDKFDFDYKYKKIVPYKNVYFIFADDCVCCT